MFRRYLYSALAVFICVCSIFTMFYINRLRSSRIGSVSYRDIYDSDGGDDYLGYIFDDYNLDVNLNYADRVPGKEYDSVSTISISALNGSDTRENMRLIRSERIIEERAEDTLK